MKITFNPKLLLLIIGIFFCSCENNVDDLTSNTDKFKLSKVTRYSDSSGSKLTGETVYDYDKTSNLITETTFVVWNSELYVQSSAEYEYLNNKKVKETHFFCNIIPGGKLNLNRYVNYHYDGELLTKIENYDGFDGSFKNSQHFEYDKRGNLILEYNYDPSYIGQGVWGGIYETGISGYKKYIYDNQNRLITALTSDGIIDFYPYLKNIYDDDGRLVKVEHLEYKGLRQYEVNIYNKTTNLLENVLSYDKDGNQLRKLHYYYDELKNLVEIRINDECSIFKRKYKGKLLIEEIHYWAHEYGYHGTGQMPESGMSRYEYKEFE